MLAEQLRQDLLANDLANVNTPGYKPDRSGQSSFGDVLLENTASGAIVGPLSMGTGISSVVTDTQQAALQQTGEPMDIAIEGDGYLEVQTPAGLRYSRGGRLLLDPEGHLSTTAGFPLLDTSGNPITVGKEDGVEIGADGTVSVDGKNVGQLALVGLTGVAKQGDSVLTGTPTALTGAVAIRQGMLESSGVDAGRVMVDMMISMRSFEASQRVLRAIDDTLGRAVNAAGSVSGG
jgi:flagellar basal-body rod protein FlgG